MSVRVSCPYCNTGFSLPEVPPGGRAVCPRCGDAFPVRSVVEEPDGASPLPLPTAPHPPRSAPRGIVRPLVIALTLLGVGVALLYLRGGSKPKPQPQEPEQPPSAAVTPPLELHGLGYLPPGCNAVLTVQPGPVLAYAARTHQDPTALLTGAGVPRSVLVTLTRAGLSVADIDHVAVGAGVPDGDDIRDLRLAFALVLRRPLADEERFVGPKAKRVEAGGPPRYELTPEDWFPMRFAVKAADGVWVFGMDEKDLGGVGGATELSPGLREVIAERVSADAAAWFAAAPERWADKKLVVGLLTLTGWSKEQVEVFKKGRAAVVGVTLRDELRLSVAVRCSDTDTAEKLRTYFKEKVTAPGATADGAGEWATFDTPTDPQAVLQMVKDFLHDAGR